MKNAVRQFGLTVAVLGLMAGLAGQAKAGIALGIDFASPGAGSGVSSWSLGYQFQVNQQVSVVGLGVLDYEQNGFSQPQQVGLWEADGTLLASTFVDNSSPLEGYWRFASIGPIALQVGHQYVVASQGGEGYLYSVGGLAVAPQITFQVSRYHYVSSTSSSPLFFPESSSGGITGYFGGNVKLSDSIAPVPEPSSIALVATALPMGLGLAWKRRRKAVSESTV